MQERNSNRAPAVTSLPAKQPKTVRHTVTVMRAAVVISTKEQNIEKNRAMRGIEE